MNTIPLVDLKAQYQTIKKEVAVAIDNVLQQASFILGEPVGQFEADFARYCGSRFCVGVASGTDALSLALRVLDIGPGDEVITAANTFVATVFAISYVGATPVLVDIDETTYNFNLDEVEKKITPRTKVIIPVHLYGQAVDMDRIMSIARKHHLSVIEDACQAHGAVWNGKKVGSFGTLGCFSFYPGKNLGAYGDGGALVASDDKIYTALKMLRNYGSSKKYYHDSIGYNSRLDTLQAAILNVKLKHLDSWNNQRRVHAKLYTKKLRGIGDIETPHSPEDASCVFHLYVIRAQKRDALLKYLNEKGIQCGIHYPVPIYSLAAYSSLGLSGKDFPVCESVSSQILSLPLYPELTEQQIEEVSSSIKQFYQNDAHY